MMRPEPHRMKKESLLYEIFFIDSMIFYFLLIFSRLIKKIEFADLN